MKHILQKTYTDREQRLKKDFHWKTNLLTELNLKFQVNLITKSMEAKLILYMDNPAKDLNL
ncbi:hypothetical protein [Leptospira santarosai]|uniref:hypothetical protein n=1 Tax=Leptospira santarosai TaxID=28183 RepID=UPI000319DEE9|nr:hypothetical protein [Leptospira santarosai]MDI7188728.1 hypothetical protein [Leptospira santarosai]